MAILAAPEATAIVRPITNTSRENNFNFLRFALAALVIFSHSFSLLTGSDKYDPFYRATHGQVFGGGLAVDGFFILSGFLIVQSWLYSKGTGDYLKKRVLRIYPGYVVAALLCIFVVGPLAVGSASVYFHTMPWKPNLRAVFLLNQIEIHPFTRLPIPAVNGSLWTIAVEFLCYLLVAALGLVGVYRERRAVLGLFVATLGFYCVKTWLGWNTAFAFPLHLGGKVNEWPRLFTFFLAGMCFHFFRDKISYTQRGLLLSLGVLALTGIFGGMCWSLPLFGAYALFYFAFSPTIRLHHFGRRADLSYGVYLYAWPIQQLLIEYVLPVKNPLLLFACALPLSCLAASVSWFAVEQPFLRMKGRRRAEPNLASAPSR